ncbi:PTS ascorbate transporter subunit IIC [Mariniblastus sp.]|nr:PTS ascorbate transporter subunit IIC [Mariniblastus sp.]MDB4756376.1 PTS ascorbate transporter subunit IIC [Mariniblastus sp.]
MGKERKNYPLRLSKQLFEDIHRMAEQEMRSVNGQIEFLLADAVKKQNIDQNDADKTTSTDQG